MPNCLFRFSKDPSLCIGVASWVSTGSPLTLQSIGGDVNKILFSYNPANKLIYLVAAGVNGLCITTPNYGCGQGQLVLQKPVPATDPRFVYQQWNFLPTSNTFINSVGCSGMVIDAFMQDPKVGTVVQLYPYNGGQAQQWDVNYLSQFDTASALETVG
jgi:hypothetical protein